MEKASIPPSPAPAPKAPAAPAAPTADVTQTTLPGGKVTRVEASASPAERPAWLPEKFKSPEELARAYGQLEQRLGQVGHAPAAAAPEATLAVTPEAAPPGTAPAPQGAPAAQDLVAKMTQEYASSGAVSAATRQEFSQRTGLPDTFIDQQISYLKAKDGQVFQAATSRLGSPEAVRELTEWARKRLGPAEREAFNRAVYSDDPALADLAISGLAAKYEQEVGRAPRIIAGRKPQQDMGGVVPFQSHAEWSAARKAPQYKTDPAYRQQVEERFRAASRLGLI